MATISENLQILKDSTDAIKQAIIDKGGTIEGDITTWADAISEISGGGAVTSASVSDVNFYDYDGTILHSYTKEQFLALSAMPELPTREGLICQGWNYILSEAVSYVTDYGKLNVGAMYITDDGDTRLYIRIATEGRMTVSLYWSQTVTNGVGIDWGDGSTIQSVSGTGNKNTTHTYAKCGDYVIRLKVASGCTLGLGNGSSSYCVMGSTRYDCRFYVNMLQKVEIGSGITNIGSYAFYYCISLASISIPTNIIDIGSYIFTNCYSLTSISIPSSVTNIGGNAFSYCNSLKTISIPNRVASIGSYAFYNCQSLKSVTLSSVSSIPSYAFDSCSSLTSISIPSSVTSIGNGAFGFCYSMAFYDFTKHTLVPTLAAQTAFNSISSDCVIKVPMSLLSDWESATNWSAFKAEIIGV